MVYPNSIDSLTNVSGSQTLAEAGHSSRHNETNTALRDLKTYLTSTVATLTTATTSIVATNISEAVIDVTISANVATLNYTTGLVAFIGTAPGANFTVNLTNAPTTNGQAISVVLFVTQGSTGYIPSAFQVEGSAQTIKWIGGSAPTPTSSAGKIDVYSFTLIRRSSAWTVLATSSLNF